MNGLCADLAALTASLRSTGRIGRHRPPEAVEER